MLALVVGALAVVMYSTHRAGHWWGDDWALYIRQAKGLLDGHPNRVLIENEFTVNASDGPEFSPPLYPWGFPLILAPFVAVVGVNLDKLTIVPVLCACLFACCWYSLARRRVGLAPALIGVAAVTITPLLLSWTELIQSEWPFLAVVGVALVCLDRVAETGGLVDERGRVAPLIIVGLAERGRVHRAARRAGDGGRDRRRPAGGDRSPSAPIRGDSTCARSAGSGRGWRSPMPRSSLPSVCCR